jgi:hypothetical protein
MQAHKGDRIVIHGQRAGRPDRDGEVLEARGENGEPPFVVRWEDNGHETLFFPGDNTSVQCLAHRDRA